MPLRSCAHLLVALLAAPLLLGAIQRVKAVLAGRRGAPLLQPYHDLAKLLRKGAVYSRTTSWIFRAGPIVGLAATLAALTLVPAGPIPALLTFEGDALLLAALLGLARFMTIAAALDTGSSFEGMGASREALVSALAEPALLIGVAAMARETNAASLSGLVAGATPALWERSGAALALVAVAFLIVLLAENARIPVDDPATHLELTMIHEVMILDHGGPDLAFILYGSALKLWILGAVLVGLVVPVRSGRLPVDAAAFGSGMLALAAVVGLVESVMARLRLVRVPQLLTGAAALALLAFLLRSR
jgi:formate hydrogenlyase subunit 4